MINNSVQFEKLFVDTFGNIDKTTLSSITENRLRFGLGDDLTDEQRTEQALTRSIAVLRECFENDSIWLRIILWNREEEAELEKAGLPISLASTIFRDIRNMKEYYICILCSILN